MALIDFPSIRIFSPFPAASSFGYAQGVGKLASFDPDTPTSFVILNFIQTQLNMFQLTIRAHAPRPSFLSSQCIDHSGEVFRFIIWTRQS